MHPTNKIAALILAAGASRRLGQPKQLIKINGETLLRRTARIASEAGCDPVIVVLGFEHEKIGEGLGALLRVSTVVNPEWEQGMASSLQAGLNAVSRHAPKSVLVLVCDQPRLTTETLRSLIAHHIRSRPDITASRYKGASGVPAIFDRTVVPELMRLRGDQGARKIIAQQKWRVETVEFPGGEIDVDDPADLTSL